MATAQRKKPYDAKKGDSIQRAQEWYSKSTGVLFADYRGLKVKDMQRLRRDLRKKGAEIHILKNTLFRIAAGDDVNKIPEELHSGPTAVAFVFENESDCAKALCDFATASKIMQIKGGYFGGRPMDAKQVEALSKLPPKDVLIAQVIGAIAAPLSNLVGVVEALYADPIRVIGAVADKVAEGSPAPAPAAAPAVEPEPAPAEPEPAAEAAPESEVSAEAAQAEDTTSAEGATEGE